MSNILESLNRGLEIKYFGEILDEAVYGGRKWSNLTDEERQKCLDADPTYAGKEDSAGKYSEWILKTYSDFKKNRPNEKFRFEHCKDALTQFMRSRENFKDESRKDIFQFDSLDELDAFLNNSQSFKNTFVEIPGGENSIRGAKKIFENDRCEIWVPLTHEASRELAGEPKTKWCTAFSNPYNYNNYTKQGPLLILIMKDNSGDMYQFHFESDSAMDKYDDPVEWEDFPEMQSKEVENFRREYFKKEDEVTCKQIDKLFQSPNSSMEELNDLIDTLHDEDLSEKYFKEVDRIMCPRIDKLLQDPNVNVRELNNLIRTLNDESLLNGYLKKVDKIACANIDSLLNRETHTFELKNDLDKVISLIRSVHDKDLILKYSEPLNKGCLEQFYANLTPILEQNSPSIKYLKECIEGVDIVLPNDVRELRSRCFDGCNSLRSIIISSSVTSIEDDVFWGCRSLKSVRIPDGVTSIGEGAFAFCPSLESIVIPDNVTSIGDRAFSECSSLGSVLIGSGVTSIGQSAFRNCPSLKSVKMPDSVASIGACAFQDCYYLGSVVIPNGVTWIGNCAFYYCRSLKSVVIPDSITSIEKSTFQNCFSLKSIVIPDSVTLVENGAFCKCTSLKDIYYGGSQKDRRIMQVGRGNDDLLNATWHYSWRGGIPE